MSGWTLTQIENNPGNCETRILRERSNRSVLKIKNGHESIDPNTFSKMKTGQRTIGHDFTSE